MSDLDDDIDSVLFGDDNGSDGGEHDPLRLEDAHLAATVADRVLRGRFCWCRGLNWMMYTCGRWIEVTEARVTDQVRRDLIAQHAREAEQGADQDRLRKLSGLLSAHRIRALVGLARGIVEVDAADFDQHPDLLNVGNGVIDFQTGRLRPHDPDLLLTRITRINYVADATSADWTEALKAIPAEVVDWLRIRVGQAATGHPTPDDVLLVLQGAGANGKTTVTGTVAKVLGGHAVAVPERVLLANPSDHPTELMTLRGARLALIEETPEARHLNVKRLKDTCGTPTMTARLIGRDNVTWEATHSLMLTTNYVPRVDEVDHGTWRRLALVRFPYTFATDATATSSTVRPAVAGLRERLRDGRQGQHEAVLAWVVGGALAWYAADRVMPAAPAQVSTDTSAWRADADLVYGYIADRLVFDPACHVMTTELYTDFSDWIAQSGHKAWADQTLTSRFATHSLVEAANVVKVRTRGTTGSLSRRTGHYNPPSTQYQAWRGVRFRTTTDADHHGEGHPTSSDGNASDQGELPSVQGVQGWSGPSREYPNIATTGVPLHTLHKPLAEAKP